MIRVLLAEDQGMMRGALAKLLSLESDMEVVAEVARGDKVHEHVQSVRSDVALLDIEMPGMSGLDACAQLRKLEPDCKVIILTTFGRPGYLRRAMESGAAGFLVKDAPIANLSVAIRRVMAGERVIDPELASAALGEGANPLKDREQEVLRVAEGGVSVTEIANRLYISEHDQSIRGGLVAGDCVKRLGYSVTRVLCRNRNTPGPVGWARRSPVRC